MPITTCVFDAYGTLFDVTAAAREAAGQPEFDAISDSWPKLAANWRLKQLRYSWLRAITGVHTDFWEVTQNGLDWALEAQGVLGRRVKLLNQIIHQIIHQIIRQGICQGVELVRRGSVMTLEVYSQSLMYSSVEPDEVKTHITRQ